MHRVAIIEDEQHGVDILSHFLKSYCPTVEIIGTAGDIETARELIDNSDLDLIFLDIMLTDGTGFELLDLIQKRPTMHVVFVTAYNDYAIKAFKYSALDYILKPIKISEVVAAVEKLSQQKSIAQLEDQLAILKNELNSNTEREKVIAISMVDKIEVIQLSDLLFIEADGKYSKFHLHSGKSVLSSKNIGEYEKHLADEKGTPIFMRVHHSYLVNLNFVLSLITKNGAFCQMPNDNLVPISRRRLTEVRNKILERN